MMKLKLTVAKIEKLSKQDIKKFGFKTDNEGKLCRESSDDYNDVYVTFKTLDDLKLFIHENGQCIINSNEICIYNDYIE